MRLRLTALAAGIAALAFAAVPGVASAAPHHNRGLTIHALPRVIDAGEGVTIFGQLKGFEHANQPIVLYHRINPNPAFSVISVTRTDSAGRYEFTRAEGVVQTNRSWFVRGPLTTHSRTIHELVHALVSLQASPTSATTGHPIVFSGHLDPNHAGGQVLLQVQKGSGDDWKTIDRGRIGPDSNYQISYVPRVPGERDIRALFPGDSRNIVSVSDPVAVTIQQAQVADFTINTNDPIVANGSPSVISGTLYQPGTTTPEPGATVQLFGHEPENGQFVELQTKITGTNGSYSFNVQTTTNELYQVRTVVAPLRASAVLFQGVQDVVNLSASSTTSTVNGHVTFTGNVSPDKAGHVIYLQKLGKDDDWHTVETHLVRQNSTFQFGWRFGSTGSKEFRARITGGPANVGGASAPVTIVVAPAPLSTLPTG